MISHIGWSVPEFKRARRVAAQGRGRPAIADGAGVEAREQEEAREG